MITRRIIRFAKHLLIIAGIVGILLKGADYFPFIKQYLPVLGKISEKAVVTPKVRVPVDTHLEEFFPENHLQRPEQILFRKSYVVSYNSITRCPNWVLWELTRAHADGDVNRPEFAFHEDMEVPVPRADFRDYKGSGYDRGHMCPAGDNKWDEEAMYETFLMTNICPQNQHLNSGLWNQIEMQCRAWAKKYGQLYIICGPIFFNNDHRLIGGNKVMVPDAFFKVVVCLGEDPKGIAFICKNTAGSRKKDLYVNTIRQAERITGYTFFPNLSEGLIEAVKDTADIRLW